MLVELKFGHAVPRLKLGRLTHEHPVEETTALQTKPSNKKHKFSLGNKQEAASRELVETGEAL